MAPRGRNSGTPDGSQGNVGENDGAIDGLVIAGNDDGNTGSIPGLVIVDPADIGGDSTGSGSGNDGNSAGEPRKRRGRKPGSGSTRSPKAQALDINGVEKILFSAHAILASLTKTPELMMDHTEAAELSKAIGSVARHYDVTASAKTVDIANLVMVAGMIYGSRIIAIRARKGKEKKERSAPTPSNTDGVITFPFPPAS